VLASHHGASGLPVPEFGCVEVLQSVEAVGLIKNETIARRRQVASTGRFREQRKAVQGETKCLTGDCYACQVDREAKRVYPFRSGRDPAKKWERTDSNYRDVADAFRRSAMEITKRMAPSTRPHKWTSFWVK
jgi:hypothetical protein